MGSMSIWHWLIVLVVVLVVFGTKKLASAGKDVGTGIRNFKDAMREGQADGEQQVASIRQNLGVAPAPAPHAPPPAGTAGTVVEDIVPTNVGAGTPPGGAPRA